MKRNIIIFILSFLIFLSIFCGCSSRGGDSKVIISKTETMWELFAPPIVVPVSDERDYWLYPLSNSQNGDSNELDEIQYSGVAFFSFDKKTKSWDSPFGVDLGINARITGAIYSNQNGCFYLKYISTEKNEQTGNGNCYVQKISQEGEIQWTSSIGTYKLTAMTLNKSENELLILANNGISSDFLALDADAGLVRRK